MPLEPPIAQTLYRPKKVIPSNARAQHNSYNNRRSGRRSPSRTEILPYSSRVRNRSHQLYDNIQFDANHIYYAENMTVPPTL